MDIDVTVFGREDLADLTRQNEHNLIAALGGVRVAEEPEVITCLLAGGKLDINTARGPMDGSHRDAIVDGRPEKALATAQVLWGKLRRGIDALPRDAFDFATAAETDPGELAKAWNLLPRHEQETTVSALRSTVKRNAGAYGEVLQGVAERFAVPPKELNTRAIAALEAATYTRVEIRLGHGCTLMRRETRAGPLEPEVYDTIDMREFLKHTGVGSYISNLGDVEEVNLVYMAELMQASSATGLVYDTTDEARVRRLIAAPRKYSAGRLIAARFREQEALRASEAKSKSEDVDRYRPSGVEQTPPATIADSGVLRPPEREVGEGGSVIALIILGMRWSPELGKGLGTLPVVALTVVGALSGADEGIRGLLIGAAVTGIPLGVIWLATCWKAGREVERMRARPGGRHDDDDL